MSYKNNGENEVRYAVNNAALGLVFDLYHGKILYEGDGVITGLIKHPLNNNMMITTMSQISNNKLLIKATPPEAFIL